jgi:hypothetical protein
MGCAGLHCPGCSDGQSLGILAAAVVGVAVADEACTWVADRIFWIGGTVFAALALAVAASMWLESWADRRGARFAARHGILSRADVILPEPVRAVVVDPVPERPALGFRDLHIHLDGMPDAAQAAIIRQALNGGRTDQP